MNIFQSFAILATPPFETYMQPQNEFIETFTGTPHYSVDWTISFFTNEQQQQQQNNFLWYNVFTITRVTHAHTPTNTPLLSFRNDDIMCNPIQKEKSRLYKPSPLLTKSTATPRPPKLISLWEVPRMAEKKTEELQQINTMLYTQCS